MIKRAAKVIIALQSPNFPISSAISANLISKGVWLLSSSSLFCMTCSLIFPAAEFGPVAKTNIHPSPSLTVVPEKTIGDGYFPDSFFIFRQFSIDSFLIKLDSPVSEASSIFKFVEEIIIPSAGIIIPISTLHLSPTKRSSSERFILEPSLVHTTWNFLKFSSLSCLNFFSLL